MPLTLSDDDKRALIESRLRSFAVDSFGHELNRQVAVAADDAEAVLAADTALGQIAVATATYQQELAMLAPTTNNELPTVEQ